MDVRWKGMLSVEEGREGSTHRGREREHSRCSHNLVIYTIIAFSSTIRVCHLSRQFASLDKAGKSRHHNSYKAVTQVLPSRCLTQLNMFSEVAAKTTRVWSDVLTTAIWTGPSLCLTKLFTSVAMADGVSQCMQGVSQKNLL